MTDILTVIEAQFIGGGSDKFYRAFAMNDEWVCQYGRNGTDGTLTKVKTDTARKRAEECARDQIDSKLKKGYIETINTTIDVTSTPVDFEDPGSLTNLADIARRRQAGGQPNAGITTARSAATVVDQTLPDQTDQVGMLLETMMGSRKATSADTDTSGIFRPMLATNPTGDQIQDMMADENVLAQFKYDGDRVLLEVVNGVVSAYNRNGVKKVSNISKAHTTALTALGRGRWVLDGEIVGRTLVLFDLACATDGERTWIDEQTGFQNRWEALDLIMAVLKPDSSMIQIAPIHDDEKTPGAKTALLKQAYAEKREGLILRERNGAYEQARRSAGVVKHKFTNEVDVFIREIDQTKQSVTMAVYDGIGITPVGKVSTNGHGIAGTGDLCIGNVWTVRFLYVNDPANPTMVQPRLVKHRRDKTAGECNIDQFKDAGTQRKV